MSVIEIVVLALFGMGLIAGASLALYSVLPERALGLASAHGRYRGLGVQDSSTVRTSGRRPVAAPFGAAGHG